MGLILCTMLSLCGAVGHISNQEMPFATKFAELRCEPRSKDPLLYSYHAKVLLPKEVYSQENIESLFRWYLRKHERDTDLLVLEIYTGNKTYRAARLCDSDRSGNIEPPLPAHGARMEEYEKELEKRRLSSPVAVFYRGRREFVLNSDYLYRYIWRPDTSSPDDEIVNFRP